MNFPFFKRSKPGVMPIDRNKRTMADYEALNRADRRKLKKVTGIMLKGSSKPVKNQK